MMEAREGVIRPVLRPLPVGAAAKGLVRPAAITWQGAAPSAVGEPAAGNVPMADDMSARKDDGAADTLAYAGRLAVPAELAGHRLFLRLDSVGCYATLRVNGAVAGTHIGSHTVWECPLDGVKAGEVAALELALRAGTNVFSPYQKAGVLRGISLLALPETAIARLAAEADFSGGTGTLRLDYALEGAEGKSGLELAAVLEDDAGRRVGSWALPTGETAARLECPGVQGWDAEHPALYTLTLTLTECGNTLEETALRVGFTEIERIDPQIIWNGRPLKLRGVNYREPLPAEGHDLRADLERLKRANVNFLRSLFYPFSVECLALCDELGFYVEQCAPFQEVDQGIASTQNAPDERDGYLGQCAEVLRDGISHPSVAIWSLGGDCTWGSNFRACYRLVKQLDGRRPVNFHLPMTVPEEEPELDVWSVAYVDWRQPMDEHYDQMVIFHTHGANNEIGYATGSAPDSAKPVLHCAYALPPCYNRDEAERDYGIHEFWGESIKRLWGSMWQTPGCLGGAVMAAADEDGRAFPRLYAHHWGVLDSAHAPKPELHHLAMAYAPVVLAGVENGVAHLENRFVHTDLDEVAFTVATGARRAAVCLRAAPGETVTLPLPDAQPGEEIALLYSAGGVENRLVLVPAPGQAQRVPQAVEGGSYRIVEGEGEIAAENSLYRFVFSATTGLLLQAAAGGKAVLVGGPCLQATRLTLGGWQGRLESLEGTGTGVRARIMGSYGAVCRVRFTLDIAGDGTVDTRCDIVSLSKPMPHQVKAGVGVDPGGLNEYGIAYIAAPSAQSLSWTRDALWPWYPEGHIGRAAGSAERTDKKDFTAMKHHLTGAVLDAGGARVVVPPQGGLSLRLEELEDAANVLDDRDERIIYTGQWRTMDDDCGNFCGTETLSDEAGAALEVRFSGTGIRVYGPHDFIYGEGAVSIDDGPPVGFSQYLAVVDRPGASRGYEKRYGLLLFEAHGLPDGPHTLRVTVSGERPAGAQGAYVSIDRLVVETVDEQRPVRLILNRDFNYARLVRGNYMRPRVAFAAGDSLAVTLRLSADGQGGETR